MPADTITLTRLSVPSEVIEDQHVWPLRIQAVSTITGLSAKIFVYHASAGDDAFAGDVFECVASLPQMGEIPEDAVVSTDPEVPYYRLQTLEFNCRSAEEADTLWLHVADDVQDLVNNFKASRQLTASETIDIS